jgi:hypothetical protein
MGLLQGIRNTFATTENYFSGLMMHVSSQPRVIKFKGSPPMEMTPKEYFTLKYAVLHGFTVSRDGDEWKLSKGDTRLRMTKESFSTYLSTKGYCRITSRSNSKARPSWMWADISGTRQ